MRTLCQEQDNDMTHSAAIPLAVYKVPDCSLTGFGLLKCFGAQACALTVLAGWNRTNFWSSIEHSFACWCTLLKNVSLVNGAAELQDFKFKRAGDLSQLQRSRRIRLKKPLQDWFWHTPAFACTSPPSQQQPASEHQSRC